jgi:2-(1,2-epoxy-1,2-dihydrophenyl)acetyl-CoA isomerase
VVGPAKAKEIYMLSDRVGAAEALGLGMSIACCPMPSSMPRATRSRCAWPRARRSAYRCIKDNIHAAANQTLRQVLDLEARNMIRCRLSEDGKEGHRRIPAKARTALRRAMRTP